MLQLELNYIVLNSNPHRTAKRNGGGGGVRHNEGSLNSITHVLVPRSLGTPLN